MTVISPKPIVLVIAYLISAFFTNLSVNNTESSRDLRISHSISAENVISGEPVMLKISVQNLDIGQARDIVIELDLPPDVYAESYRPESGAFSSKTGIWEIGQLTGGQAVSLELSLLTLTTSDISFSARISKADPQADPVLQNNETQGVIKINADDCPVIFHDLSTDTAHNERFLFIDCIESYPNNVLYVYDRWGDLVFEQARYDNSWNGKRHPRFTRLGWDELPNGTYYYILNFPEKDRDDKSGWIYLRK